MITEENFHDALRKFDATHVDSEREQLRQERDTLQRQNAELAAALAMRNLALQQIWNRLLAGSAPSPEAFGECRSVIRDCRDATDPAAILRDHDAAVKHEASKATMDWVLKATKNAILHPEDLEREDDDAMQAWKDLKVVLTRALREHDAALTKPLEKYVQHQRHCAISISAVTAIGDGRECTCGLSAALAPYRKQEVVP
jgi:hypothetical protein